MIQFKKMLKYLINTTSMFTVKISKYKYIFAITDFIILISSVIISAYIIEALFNIDFGIYYSRPFPTVLFFLTILISLYIVFNLNHLYKTTIILTRSAHLTAVLKSLWYMIFILIFASLIFVDTDFMKLFLLLISFILVFIFNSYLFRIEYLRRFFLRQNKNKKFTQNVLIVGDGKPGRMLATKLTFENPIGINIVGFIDSEIEIGEHVIHGKKVLGNYSHINELLKKYHVDEILIAFGGEDYEQLFKLIDQCKEMKVSVKISSDLFSIIPQKFFTEKYSNLPVIDVSPVSAWWYPEKVKRIFDLCFAFSGLIFFSPLLVLIALAIKITSKGPVLFNQIRIGKNGVPFSFYKFRTMYLSKNDDVDRKEKMISFMKSSNLNSSGTKIISDARITTIGRLLRKTSLDEIPQLFNVLKGDMSVVGPRPCLPYEYENYDLWQKRRLNVMPGCTGVWQVTGRSSVSFKDSVILDLYYINTMSPWLDLQLTIKTIPVMLFSRGGK
jgi:exopolysaccharide biosynthesis polyprenyl glycosylphosphotransferase